MFKTCSQQQYINLSGQNTLQRESRSTNKDQPQDARRRTQDQRVDLGRLLRDGSAVYAVGQPYEKSEKRRAALGSIVAAQSQDVLQLTLAAWRTVQRESRPARIHRR